MSIDGSGTSLARCVLAPNPSPMTLDGTNTWILADPKASEAVVVDPGPDDEGHLRRVRDAVAAQERRVTVALLTHGHPDHAAGARRFAELAGCGVRALDPTHRLGDEGLAEGDVVGAAGLDLRVLHLPGHSRDSLGFLLPAEGGLLTGDTILGRGTTIIAPDGGLGDYLGSLYRLRELTEAQEIRVLLPGHGPMHHDPLPVIDFYLAHREERLKATKEALAEGLTTPAEIVRRVYTDVDPKMWPFAEQSVRAQLEYLWERG